VSDRRWSELPNSGGSHTRFFHTSFEPDKLGDQISEIGWQRLRQRSRIELVEPRTGYDARAAAANAAVQD
jgi:hypothetical protein